MVGFLKLGDQLAQREMFHRRGGLAQVDDPFSQPTLGQLAIRCIKRMLFALAADFPDPVISPAQRMTVQAGHLRHLHELLPGAFSWTHADRPKSIRGDDRG
jgi:hypothetical protein